MTNKPHDKEALTAVPLQLNTEGRSPSPARSPLRLMKSIKAELFAARRYAYLSRELAVKPGFWRATA